MTEQLDRQKLLDEFGLLTEEQVAVLFGIKVKSLRERATDNQPVFTKAGPCRLYAREAVIEFMASRNNR